MSRSNIPLAERYLPRYLGIQSWRKREEPHGSRDEMGHDFDHEQPRIRFMTVHSGRCGLWKRNYGSSMTEFWLFQTHHAVLVLL